MCKLSLFTTPSLALALLTPAVSGETGSQGALTWRACTDPALEEFQCARLIVPADPANPAAGTFDLAVARHRSTGGPAQRIGSLIFNPGGPGVSGLEDLPQIWDLLPETVRRRFDLVTWDPRGVGSTTPALVDCPADAAPELPPTGPVDWDTVLASYRSDIAAANMTCFEKNRDFIEYLGTNAAVRDLDALRRAVGDDRISFWGQSYGSRIGYVYALTYPERVRVLVLDGSVDPAGSILGKAEGYGPAMENASGIFFERHPDLIPVYQRIENVLASRTLPLPSGNVFTRWDFYDLTLTEATVQRLNPDLVGHLRLIETALLGTGPAAERALRDLDALMSLLSSQDENGGLAEVTSIVDCLDYPDRPDAQEQMTALRETDRRAPRLGALRAMALVTECEGLPVTPDPIPQVGDYNWTTSLLIAGSTRDPATPYGWAVRMARAFPWSRMVTYVGAQHVIFGQANSSCIDHAVSSYLVSGVLPSVDIACPNVAP